MTDKKSNFMPLTILTLVSLACLAPFANKPFHIDDPLFLWSARQIQHDPFDFYGLEVNWGGRLPMSEIQKNPPLTSYYIALIAFLFGWREISVHLAFLISALSAVIGIYCMSKELCRYPLAASLACIVAPVFLLSSTTVMSDVMMLSFWVWAIYLWRRGIKNNSHMNLFLAVLCIAACSLTKYYGIALIPLLLTYSLVERHSMGRWVFFLLMPIIIFGIYLLAAYLLYGSDLFRGAASYAANLRVGGNPLFKTFTALAFSGGCIITAFFYTPLLWTRRTLVFLGSVFAALVVANLYFIRAMGLTPSSMPYFSRPGYVIQFSLLTITGLSIVMLAIKDLLQKKDADSLLLFLSIIGTLVFAAFINWTVSGRNLLPILPSAGILIIRKLEQGRVFDQKCPWYVFLPLAPSLLIALSVTLADYRLAGSARKAAFEITQTYKNMSGTLWFQGHWGFQYYMEGLGAKALDMDVERPMQGDIIIIPLNNSFTYPLPDGFASPIGKFRYAPLNWLTTMNASAGAGFYSDGWGALPYVIGQIPVEEYYVLRVR